MKLRERPIRNDLLLLAFAFLVAWSGQQLILSATTSVLEQRWEALPAQVPLRMTSLSGSLSPQPGTHSLDHFEGLATQLTTPIETPLEVSVRVFLPTSGMIRLALYPPKEQNGPHS